MTGVLASLAYPLHPSDIFLFAAYLVIAGVAIIMGFSEEPSGASRRRRRQREARRAARAEARARHGEQEREGEAALPRAVVYRQTREIER